MQSLAAFFNLPQYDLAVTNRMTQSQIKRAVDLQTRVVNLAPDAPAYRLQLAKLLIEAGNRSTARSELKTLAELGDKFPRQGEVTELMRKLN